MKKPILTIALLLFSFSIFSQQITYDILRTAEKKPKRGAFSSYVSKDGSVYTLGNSIRLGKPSKVYYFQFITWADNVTEHKFHAPASAGTIGYKISQISFDGNKQSGFKAILKVEAGTRWGGSRYLIDIEKAHEVGELKSQMMSSDEALTALKKAKEKLDLGLITEEKYDSIKTMLSKFIN